MFDADLRSGIAPRLTLIYGDRPMPISCRCLIVAFSLLIPALSLAEDRYVTLKAPHNDRHSPLYQINEDEIAILLYVSGPGTTEAPSHLIVAFIEGAGGLEVPLLNSNMEHARPTIPGPAGISYRKDTDSSSRFATLLIRKKVPVTDPAPVPVASVVIPQDEGGQYQVILESSTDTITWTQAQPGTYGGTTEKRFFRTRIVKTN